jgi:hypothetical protein
VLLKIAEEAPTGSSLNLIIMYRGKVKWALSTYTIQKEPMFTLSIHIKLRDVKIDILYNRFIDKPTDDFCKLICT